MDIKEYTKPDSLEKYSFFWSEVRLVIAAIALFLGGIPPVLKILSSSSGLYSLVGSLLTLAWIISGVASAYLLYRWYIGGRMLFGGKDKKDMAAFLVASVSGLNLGLAGLLGSNIGMSISSSTFIFVLVGLLYLASAFYLWRRWNASGKRIFQPTSVTADKSPE